MASNRKSYHLAPSWGIKPSEITLGSAVASIISPESPLSNSDLHIKIDTEVHVDQARDCSGTIKDGNKWSIGVFATFLQFITAGSEVSFSSKSCREIEYSCELIETRRFVPSPSFIAEVAADSVVKSHLKTGGMGAKVFVVTGVKTAKGLTITTTEERETETAAQIGADFLQTKVGPKAAMSSTKYRTHTETIDGPTVFAFEVHKIHVTRKRDATSKLRVVGAVLGQRKENAEYVIEMADADLDDGEMDDGEMDDGEMDDGEMDDFGVESQDGLDEHDEACRIIVPGRFDC